MSFELSLMNRSLWYSLERFCGVSIEWNEYNEIDDANGFMRQCPLSISMQTHTQITPFMYDLSMQMRNAQHKLSIQLAQHFNSNKKKCCDDRMETSIYCLLITLSTAKSELQSKQIEKQLF